MEGDTVMEEKEISEFQKWRIDNEASVFETHDHFTHKRIKEDMERVQRDIEYLDEEFSTNTDPNVLAILSKLEGAISTLIEHTSFAERRRRR